jgi:hypothetical protein
MPTGSRGTELSDLHMIVLGRIAHRAIADGEDIARWHGVPITVAEALCADLKAGPAHGSARPLTSRGAGAPSTTFLRGHRSLVCRAFATLTVLFPTSEASGAWKRRGPRSAHGRRVRLLVVGCSATG